ncbi:MAG: RNA polymerase sigma factor RpoH [Betaproteobacteria bacterium]|jgi:RNA polymerase sigma-32 factor|nr:RNA polymerase sigma factor RpoH [Betaproteobacteria bacterium]
MTVLSSSTALTLPQLSPLANLDGYIRAVQQFPLLSARQEQEFALKFRTLGDLEAARMLVLSHLRLVVAVSRQYLGYGLPQADLIQEGNVGLMKAVKRFDPTQGVRLVSYALHWIKAEIHEYILRNWQMVKVATTKAQRKLFFNLKSLKRALGADAAVTTDQAQVIAKELNVSRDEVMEMDRRLSGGDTPLEPVNDDGETVGPIASLAAENADPAYLVAEAQEAQVMGAQLRTALEGLDPRSRAIVQARWLADSDEKGPTLHDLAAEYGVSAERVRQIEAAALKKIKKLMLAQ